MELCECGLSYEVGLAGDEHLHAHMHEEHLRGPDLPSVSRLAPIGTIGQFRVMLIDSNTPEEIRREGATVAQVARRAMRRFPAGYDGSVTEEDPKLYLVLDGSRAIGMALSVLGGRLFGTSRGSKLVARTC